MNYGEDIAYWYLRLNGFFLVQNFVSHGDAAGQGRAQVDVMAVRPAFVEEQIGDGAADWDPALFDLIGGTRQTVGLICEVKTGRYNGKELFTHASLPALVARLGLLPPDARKQLLSGLSEARHATIGPVTIGKLLIAANVAESQHFHCIALDDAEEFVQRRAQRFAAIKHRDRMLFPWGLFQYAINRERERLD